MSAPKLPPAVDSWQIWMVHEVIDTGIGINDFLDNGYTPLTMALALGREKEASMLLDLGADPGRTSQWGHIPLHFAIINQWDALIDRMLSAGVDITQSGPYLGNTALHLAAVIDDLDLITRLIAMGADTNARSTLNHGPLNFVQSVNAAQILVSNGATVAVEPGVHGPLHAAAGRSLELVRYYLEQGADLLAKDENGLTATDYAKAWGNDEAYEYLRNLEQTIETE